MTSQIELSANSKKGIDFPNKKMIICQEGKDNLNVNFKQSLESVERIPELESENYKIDRYLSLEEKLQNGRTKNTIKNGIIYLSKNLSGRGRVIELALAGEKYIGEQKFNIEAVESLGLKDRLPKNYKEFENIRDKWIKENNSNHQGFLNRYFSKNDEIILTGLWTPSWDRFTYVFLADYLLLGDNNYLIVDNKDIHSGFEPIKSPLSCGFSVRLLKS